MGADFRLICVSDSLIIRYRKECIWMAKKDIIAAIRRAGKELGRAPSRGELKRITGVSHYRVLTEFRSLREAVRAAGMKPNPKGERIKTAELIKDWERVRKKLGRRPSRAEYVREGRYSAGAFVGRFGAWGKIKSSTTEDTKEHREKKSGDLDIGTAVHRKIKTRSSRESTRKARINGKTRTAENAVGAERSRGTRGVVAAQGAEKAIALQWAGSLATIPGPLEGKRRVTEAVAAMIVNTLLPNQSLFTTEDTEKHRGARFFPLRSSVPSVVKKDRPVMGAPFARHPLTNAPVNEMGVVFLFALVAWDLGFQVEALWGRYPDGRAKREVAPGKWQDVAIEFEYESKNFVLHGHDPKKCDVIVCWRHNWKECPESIEVIELCSLVG
jgi:Homing endonuclease associated repeat